MSEMNGHVTWKDTRLIFNLTRYIQKGGQPTQ